MASRSQQKALARERRLEQERAAARAAGRRRRLQLLVGTVVVALVLAGVGIAISATGHGSGSGGGLATGGASTRLTALVDAELRGIPEHGTTLGNPDAKLTLTLYGDLQCPICAALTTGADGGGLPQFIADQVRPGHAKIVYRSMCTATCNDFSQTLFDEQQTAAYAAGLQNRFWYYEELFYREQGAEGTPYVTPAFLRRLAAQVPGLDLGVWSTARFKPSLGAQVQNDERAATRQLPLVDGGRGTPGLIVSGPRGTRFVAEGLVDYAKLETALAAVS